MKILFIILVLAIGFTLTIFSDFLIKLLNEDRYIDHKKNKFRKIIVGIGMIIGGIWMLIEYLFWK